jgi:hypothetical protein
MDNNSVTGDSEATSTEEVMVSSPRSIPSLLDLSANTIIENIWSNSYKGKLPDLPDHLLDRIVVLANKSYDNNMIWKLINSVSRNQRLQVIKRSLEIQRYWFDDEIIEYIFNDYETEELIWAFVNSRWIYERFNDLKNKLIHEGDTNLIMQLFITGNYERDVLFFEGNAKRIKNTDLIYELFLLLFPTAPEQSFFQLMDRQKKINLERLEKDKPWSLPQLREIVLVGNAIDTEIKQAIEDSKKRNLSPTPESKVSRRRRNSSF